MEDRFNNTSAPFIPVEPLFNEQAIRESDAPRPQDTLFALGGKVVEDGKGLSFDRDHFEKFLKQDTKATKSGAVGP